MATKKQSITVTFKSALTGITNLVVNSEAGVSLRRLWTQATKGVKRPDGAPVGAADNFAFKNEHGVVGRDRKVEGDLVVDVDALKPWPVSGQEATSTATADTAASTTADTAAEGTTQTTGEGTTSSTESASSTEATTTEATTTEATTTEATTTTDAATTEAAAAPAAEPEKETTIVVEGIGNKKITVKGLFSGKSIDAILTEDKKSGVNSTTLTGVRIYQKSDNSTVARQSPIPASFIGQTVTLVARQARAGG